MDINNKIQEDYCSFEVSKLLKEKGFWCDTYPWYNDLGDYMGRTDLDIDGNSYEESHPGSLGFIPIEVRHLYSREHYRAPTHALAVKWIRENFGVIINPVYLWLDKYWGYEIYTGTHNHDEIEEYKTLEEAAEAALLYTLNNLI